MEDRCMESRKIMAVRWPRTFRDLMAKARAEVRRSRFVGSEHRRAGIPDEEYIEDAQDEIKSVMQSLETVGDTSKNGDDLDFDELLSAVKNLDYAMSSLGNVLGFEKQQKFLQEMDSELARLVRESHEEYKRWDREQTRHRIENMGLADKATDLSKKLKGIRI